MELLDRRLELDSLEELLAAARAGRGDALVLRGAAGIGLSALLDHAAREAASACRVVRVAGVRSEAELPLAGLQRLAMLFDEPTPPVPSPSVAQNEPLATGLAVHALLTQAARADPVVLVIDDAHLLDRPSLEAIAFACRRLRQHRVAAIVATHATTTQRSVLHGVPEAVVGSLGSVAAAQLLTSALAVPIDRAVHARLLTEADGNPLALLELPGQLRPDQIAGSAALPTYLPVGPTLRASLLSSIEPLAEATQLLLLLAAIEPDVPTASFWRAAAELGLSAEALAPAEAAGVIDVGSTIALRPRLLGAAVYEAASLADRQRVHQSLVAAFDPLSDRDRRAPHLASGTLTPDEDVALEVERAAERAHSLGDPIRAAGLLERAAALSPDSRTRCRRTLAAAQAALAGGAVGRATALVGEARVDAGDDVERARADRLRSTIALAAGKGADRGTLLLRAARAFESLDSSLARETYLEALEASILAGRLGGGRVVEIAEAGRSIARAPAAVSAADLLLEGLTLLVSADHAAAVPVLRRALAALGSSSEPRWLALGSLTALELWDDELAFELLLRLEQNTFAVGSEFRLDRIGPLDDVIAGRFAVAAPLLQGAGDSELSASVAGLLAAAWRGRPTEAHELAETWMREAFTRDLGSALAVARYALTLVSVGLARYEEALATAREACEDTTLFVTGFALPELVEAAARSGERELAVAALDRLTSHTRASGTDWALGILARSRALLEDGVRADRLYQAAIAHLRRTRAVPHLARAHLVYGEWLRRERRRREAREQLRTARDMFIFMGAQAFGERARAELTATGEQARARAAETAELLTPQEARIAGLVADGASNVEVGAQLFISPKTVEYHLHKVFRKLGVTSRTQLARALAELEAEGIPSGRSAQD
jgi:DNA-binding CsgD family transcriptional regulator